ncbi:MAG: cupin domain-containing protein [Myxococcota bacterium]
MKEGSFGVLVQPDDVKWIETPGGNAVKVLRVSEESGSWTALFRAAAGTTNPPHIHLGPADFYMLSGVMEYAGGVSRAGDWIYEPNGAEHEATYHPEETVYLANVHGAIAFYGEAQEEGGERPIVGISDWRGMKALYDAARS